MDLTVFAERSLALMSPLGPVLHRAMEPSIEDARLYLAKRRFDGYVFADLTRYHTCCRLEDAKLPAGIKFERLANNGILLRCNNCLARVWKADESGKLQGPGTSRSKQEFFAQDDLFSPDPMLARFAIVWEYDFKTGLLRLALACPKKFDESRPWNNPECHFYIDFPHAASAISADRRFESKDANDDIDLKPKRKVGEGGNDEGND